MRIVLVIVIALAASVGCAKKSKPAAAPTAPAEMKESSAPGGAPNDETKDKGSETKGDPCDGGETKGK